MGKTPFAHFGGLQKILNKIDFQIFIWAIVLWNKMKELQMLKNNNF